MAAGVGRGRASAQALSIAGSDVFRIPRAPPPAELEPDEAAEWRAIVGALPPEHFPRDTHPLLVAYVIKDKRLRQIRSRLKQICETIPMDDELYLKWRAAETSETRALAMLATLHCGWPRAPTRTGGCASPRRWTSLGGRILTVRKPWKDRLVDGEPHRDLDGPRRDERDIVACDELLGRLIKHHPEHEQHVSRPDHRSRK